MAEPDVVCVLGMHRSGTSLVMRAANALGVALGPEEHLMPPVEDNPTGFWEHELLTELNDEILAAFGGSWHDPPPLPPGWEDDPRIEELRLRARRVVAEDFADLPRWGWKDPRACLTLPFWQRVMPPMGYVICLRNPLDVARSLERRNGFPIRKGIDLWLAYLGGALGQTVGQPRLLLFYEDFVEDWRRGLRGLAAFIGRPEQAEQPEVRSTVEAFVAADLRHHRSGLAEVLEEPEVAYPAKALYLALRAAVGGDRSDGQDAALQDALGLLGRQARSASAALERAPATVSAGRPYLGGPGRDRGLRELRDHFDEQERAVRDGDGGRSAPGAAERRTIDEQARQLDRLREQLEAALGRERELRRMLIEAHEALYERDLELQQLRERAASLDAIVAERTAWAERVVAEAEERLRLIEEQTRIIGEYATMADEHRRVIPELRERAERAERTIREMRATPVWRTASAVKRLARR